MEQKIKQILKSNKLYDENKIIDVKACSNLDVFFETYIFNGKKKQKLPNNLKRDNSGKIILDNVPFIVSNKTSINIDNKWIILNNGTKLLLKYAREEKYNIIELILMYFFKQSDINCANYDLATLNGEQVLVSTSFLQNNEKIILPFKGNPKIDEAYKIAKENRNEAHLLKTFFVDRVYGNIDRFPCNYGLIKGGDINKCSKQVRNCPIFDNSQSNAIFIREDKYGYNLFPYVDKENDSSCNKVINHLLNYEEIMHWIKQVNRKMNLQIATERLYKEKNIYVDKDIYKEIESFFSDSETIINEELKNKGKSFKIKLT